MTHTRSYKRGERELRGAIRRWRRVRRGSREVEGVNDAPACVYGMVVGEKVDNILADIEDVKAEITWIRRVIVTAVAGAAVATLLRFAGWG